MLYFNNVILLIFHELVMVPYVENSQVPACFVLVRMDWLPFRLDYLVINEKIN